MNIKAHTFHLSRAWSIGAIAITMAMGCTDSSLGPDSTTIDAILESNGDDIDLNDELPAFGDARIEALEDSETNALYEDPIAQNLEVRTIAAQPETRIVHATLLWGQLRGDPDAETRIQWDGEIRLNRGAIIVQRTLRFEARTDNLLSRTARHILPFTSLTGPHFDGLIVTIYDPTPGADEPQVLSYVNRVNAERNTRVHVDALLRAPQTLWVDQEGNRMLARGVSRSSCADLYELSEAAPAVCVPALNSGFIGGVWRSTGNNRGEILGRVRNEHGVRIGHVRGVYGERLGGDQVFFAKYIDLEGHVMGLVRGTYGDGNFVGRWIHRHEDRGTLRGVYREATDPTRNPNGFFAGTWHEQAFRR